MKIWKPIVYAVVLVAGLILGGECRDFRRRAREVAAPTVAPPTAREDRSGVITLPCETVQVIEPTAKDRQRIGERYNRTDLLKETPSSRKKGEMIAGSIVRILAERKLPKMPEGGTALVTLEPGGAAAVTVKADPERTFDWRNTREVGALAGKSITGDNRGRAWAAVEPIRFGRLHLRAEAGLDLRAGTTDAYAMAGVVWRSR